MLAQLVKYDVHATCRIKSIHSVFYHILLVYIPWTPQHH